MTTVQSLFERYGIESPQQIADRRRKEALAQLSQYSDTGKIGFGIGTGIASLFGGDPAMAQAKESEKYMGALSAIPQENMSPEVENYYRAQLANIDPALADAFVQDQRATREALLKAQKSMFGTVPIEVPEFKIDKEGNRYQSGTTTIEVPAKFDPERGWVPIDAKYNPQAGDGTEEAPAVRIDSMDSLAAKLGYGNQQAEDKAAMLPASSGRPVDMPPTFSSVPLDVQEFNRTIAAPDQSGLVSYGGRNWEPAEFKQRFPVVYATMVQEGKIKPIK